ncbi:MAG: VWA domain-containing protein [Gammaproteobacteria bacterium]|nr:VWA domain-containing protein [Gammaproteobacteria bacterium]
MRRRRRDTDTLSLSFLDAISCGFGAIILLLVIVKIYEPQLRAEVVDDTEARLAFLQQRLADIQDDTRTTSERMSSTEAELVRERDRLERLRRELARIESATDETRTDAQVMAELESRLQRAKQQLTEEMQRLLADFRPAHMDQQVGGIPIDAEWVVFVIDTSPSMTNYTWPRMMQTMEEILDVYPQVKGMQVMNDMGTHLFRGRQGEWIDDTPAFRRSVLQRLQSWRPFSNSSPVEGLMEAVRLYGRNNDNVSIYYLGDEMHGHDLHGAAERVRISNQHPDGGTWARIHSVGFPVIFDYTGAVQETGLRFAVLMRIICEQNNGTFVALHSGRDRRR